jgi:hypothetical protein
MILDAILYRGHWVTVGAIKRSYLYDRAGKLTPTSETTTIRVIV